MSKLKIPDGKFSYYRTNGYNKILIGDFDNNIDVWDIGIEEEQSEHLARLIVSAGNAYQESKLTPKELLFQRNELINVCRRILANELNSGVKLEKLLDSIDPCTTS